MRFLHAADLHLDSPLQTMALRNPVLFERLRDASRDVLRRLIDLAIEDDVTALLLAGDVFDSSAPDLTARAVLVSELGRLAKAGIDTVLIWGNHDATLASNRYGPLGERIHILDKNTPTLRMDGVAIHGIGFAQRHCRESLLPQYPDPEPGVLNVGLMHTSLDGAPGHDDYAPCATSELLAHGYDYWALGHIHKRSEHHGERCLAVMTGIPQGRHINEDAGGSVTLVAIDAQGVRVKERPIAKLTFARLSIPLEATVSQTERLDRIASAAEPFDLEDRDTALRIVLEGPGAASLLAEADAGRVFVEEALSGLDNIHLDTVEVNPGRASPSVADIGDLAGLMHEEINKQGFCDEISAEFEEWRRGLPKDLREALPVSGVEIDELGEAGIASVLARLQSGADTP